MPRPQSERRIGAPIPPRVLRPDSAGPEAEEVSLRLDEAEALRLADYQGLYQEAAARSMGVSRQTFGNIVESARRKIADALLNGKVLRIEGGQVSVKDDRDLALKLAVPSRHGILDEHFGQAPEFLIFRVEDGALLLEESLQATAGRGCKSSIGSELAKRGVTHVIAGSMGTGAYKVLASNGITAIRGASGDARSAALAFARGELKDSGVACPHSSDGKGGCKFDRRLVEPDSAH